MRKLLRAIDRTNQFIGLSVSHLYLICTAVTTYEVAMRYFFNSPTQWAFEVVMVTCASAWALSGGIITMRRAHIAITVFHEKTKGKVRWYLDLFILIVSIGAMFTFAYSLWEPMIESLPTFGTLEGLERSGTSFNSPEPAILKTLLWVGAMMYGIQLLVNLVKHFIGDGVEKKSDLSEN